MADRDRDCWQDSVNAAELLLLLARGQTMGMCSGLTINRNQCEFILRRGQDMRIFPDVLERRLKRLQPA